MFSAAALNALLDARNPKSGSAFFHGLQLKAGFTPTLTPFAADNTVEDAAEHAKLQANGRHDPAEMPAP